MIKNGYIEGADFYYHDQVYYRCNKGYELFGNSNRSCLESGKWSGSTPMCRYVGLYYLNMNDHEVNMKIYPVRWIKDG